MISDDKLKEWRALCEQATRGPWTFSDWSECTQFVAEITDGNGNKIAYFNCDCQGQKSAEANLRVMTESRTAMPVLLDEVQRLQRRVDKLEADVRRILRQRAETPDKPAASPKRGKRLR